MAGREDWEQRALVEAQEDSIQVWVHKPCGAFVAMDLTDVHDKVCVAGKESS